MYVIKPIHGKLKFRAKKKLVIYSLNPFVVCLYKNACGRPRFNKSDFFVPHNYKVYSLLLFNFVTKYIISKLTVSRSTNTNTRA